MLLRPGCLIQRINTRRICAHIVLFQVIYCNPPDCFAAGIHQHREAPVRGSWPPARRHPSLSRRRRRGGGTFCSLALRRGGRRSRRPRTTQPSASTLAASERCQHSIDELVAAIRVRRPQLPKRWQRQMVRPRRRVLFESIERKVTVKTLIKSLPIFMHSLNEPGRFCNRFNQVVKFQRNRSNRSESYHEAFARTENYYNL